MNEKSEELNNLTRSLNSFINETKEYNFFVGVADYIAYVHKVKEAEPVVKLLERQYRMEYDRLGELEQRTLEELQEPYKEAIGLKDSVLIQGLESVLKAIERVERIMSNETVVMMPTRVEALEEALFGIVVSYCQTTGKTDAPFLQRYRNPKTRRNIYGDYRFAKTLESFRYQKQLLEDNGSIWYAWYWLDLVRAVLFNQSRKELEEYAENPNSILPANQIQVAEHQSAIFTDWSHIKESEQEIEIPTAYGKVAIDPIIRLKVDKFRLYANRFNNYLFQDVSGNGIFTATVRVPRPKVLPKPVLDFSPAESILRFQGKEILISKSKNKNPHYLLQTLFKIPQKLYNFDEIAEDWGDKYTKDDWKRYYNAGYKVNQKVAEKTTVNDFLEMTTKTIKINAKYLNLP